MKFFVTGRSNNYDRVKAVYDDIDAKGHEVTLRWTDFPMVKPYDKNSEKAAQFSEQQISGIISADVYIHFAHSDGNGVFTELGIALGAQKISGKPAIYAVGDKIVKPAAMFHYHNSIKWFDSVEAIYKELGL